MGYQFLHLEAYARVPGKGKAGGHSIASVVAEAERQPGACPHVVAPQAPVLLFGCPPSQAAVAAESWATQAMDTRGHKLRKDGLCLVSGVISVPKELGNWKEYKNSSVCFLKNFYGPRLRSVVEHTDEKERHLHFYAVPLSGERFEVLHPGRAAAALSKAAGQKKGEQNKAYKNALRRWQDHFFMEVSSRYGLTRIGPGRRRLTRAEWKAEQEQAQLSAKIARENQELRANLIYQAQLLKKLRRDPEINPLMRLKHGAPQP